MIQKGNGGGESEEKHWIHLHGQKSETFLDGLMISVSGSHGFGSRVTTKTVIKMIHTASLLGTQSLG